MKVFSKDDMVGGLLWDDKSILTLSPNGQREIVSIFGYFGEGSLSFVETQNGPSRLSSFSGPNPPPISSLLKQTKPPVSGHIISYRVKCLCSETALY